MATRALLLAMFEEACRAASPDVVMPPTVPISPHGRTVAIAIGKAAAEMMRIAQSRAPRPLEGLVVTRYGHMPPEGASWPGVEIIEAGHPIPDENSVRAALRALDLAHELKAGDRLLVLISGGGSALATAPVRGVTLEDKQKLTHELLRSGATIAEINCVRKHLSAIKGGRLAVAAAPAAVTTWIISDVPGDDPSLVSSGPTIADRTTLETARDIVARWGIPVTPAVERALADPSNETPPAQSSGLKGAEIRIIAQARTAIGHAARLAVAQGFAVTDLGDEVQGEARLVGASQAELARKLAADGRRHAILSGGETSVTVTHPGAAGGRNLEYLLGLAIALAGAPGISAIAGDTDGIDGTSNAAGAMIFPDTLERASALGLDAAQCLAANRSHDFFEALGDLVITGPTLTNVNDLRAILIDRDTSDGAEQA